MTFTVAGFVEVLIEFEYLSLQTFAHFVVVAF